MVWKILKTGGVVPLTRLKWEVGRGLGGMKLVNDHKLVINSWIQLVLTASILLITEERGRNQLGLENIENWWSCSTYKVEMASWYRSGWSEIR